MIEQTETNDSDALEAVRQRLAKHLDGFSPVFPSGKSAWDLNSFRPDRKDFPVPELVLFTFRNVMGWRWSGPGEKVRWTVYGSVEGEPIAFELQKFGFTILRPSDHKVPLTRIVGQMRNALRQIEELLEPFAAEQAQNGEVLVVNRWGEFEARYRFFREKANKSFFRAAKPPRTKESDHLAAGTLSRVLNHMSRFQHEGFFYATAMIDAYFSALEHRTILLRAFTGRPLDEGGLGSLLTKSWDEKLKTINPALTKHPTSKVLGQMRQIKERLRNPLSHGGVENDGGSLFFHLPKIGVIPANFSRFADSPRFSFIPIEGNSFEECCSVFDELDKLLSSGPLKLPHRFVEAGVDPSFDVGTLKEYADAITAGKTAVEEWIERWGHDWSVHANMDY